MSDGLIAETEGGVLSIEKVVLSEDPPRLVKMLSPAARNCIISSFVSIRLKKKTLSISPMKGESWLGFRPMVVRASPAPSCVFAKYSLLSMLSCSNLFV